MSGVSDGEPGREALPPLEALEPFPEYPFFQSSEVDLPMHVSEAVNVALDFTNQCMDCRYKVGSVVGQEVYERDRDPNRFIVWQDVSKQILPRIHVKSSSFAEVRLFGSADGHAFQIDTKSLDRDRAGTMAARLSRRSNPAFDVLHSRWTLTGSAGGSEQPRVHIRLEAGGRTAGIAKLIPKPILRFELKNVIEESLAFYRVHL